jgi:hypothetical protein
MAFAVAEAMRVSIPLEAAESRFDARADRDERGAEGETEVDVVAGVGDVREIADWQGEATRDEDGRTLGVRCYREGEERTRGEHGEEPSSHAVSSTDGMCGLGQFDKHATVTEARGRRFECAQGAKPTAGCEARGEVRVRRWKLGSGAGVGGQYNSSIFRNKICQWLLIFLLY